MPASVAHQPFEVALVAAEHPHAAQHLATLRLLDEVRGVHLCLLDGADPAPLAATLGAKARPVAGGLEDVLARPEVDALLVAVRNDQCPDVLRQAVEAGTPALFEKPGATSAAQLGEVAILARERGVTLGAVLPWRYHPISRQVRDLVREGALGRLLAVEARMVTSQVRYRDPGHWLFRRETAGGSGILGWLGIHWLDLLCFFTGRRVARVTALAAARNPEGIELEDTACVALEYDDGTLGTLHAGYLLPGSAGGYRAASYDNYLALRGYEGYVTWPHAGPPSYTVFSTAAGHATDGPQERRVELPPWEGYAGRHGAEFVRDFLAAGRERRPAPCPIEDAAHALAVVDAAVTAAATGRAQQVPHTHGTATRQ
jgi:predicted dehydrogenase